MKTIVFLSLLLVSIKSFSGVGGFDQYTCTSKSARTSLIYVKEHFPEAGVPNKATLVIDGYFAQFAPKYVTEGVWESESSTSFYDYRTDEVTFYEGPSFLKIKLRDNKAYIADGSYDPRPNQASTPAIMLDCKKFHQEP